MIVNQCLYREVLNSLAPKEAYHFFIRLIAQMEGFKTRLKEIHWAAENMSTHKLVDDILDSFTKFQDAVAEDVQGEFGDFPVGSIHPLLPSSTELIPLLKEMRYEILIVPLNGIDGDMYTGIINEMEDFYHKLNVFIYLARKVQRG